MYVSTQQPAERTLLFVGDYHPMLTWLLRQHTPRGGYCLDVGANVGFYTVKFAAWVGPEGRVAAFEANPEMRARLERNVALNEFTHVDVVAQAVHQQAGLLPFYVASSPGKSSLIAQQVSVPVAVLTVEAVSLDEYLRANAWNRLDAVKIDIEGNDCHALLGAVEALTRFRPFIAFEYWYNTAPEVSQAAFKLLHELGYTLSGLTVDGRCVPFDPQRPEGKQHIDIVGVAEKAP